MLGTTERPEQTRRRTPRQPPRTAPTTIFIPRGWAPAHEVLRRSFSVAHRTEPRYRRGGSGLSGRRPSEEPPCVARVPPFGFEFFVAAFRDSRVSRTLKGDWC